MADHRQNFISLAMSGFRVVSLFTILGFTYTLACEIELPHGQLQGSIVENYYSYTNIRYAEPAVRFEPPKPYNTYWKGIQNATGEMLSCVQFDRMSNGSVELGQEDCLFLHVFVPKQAATNLKRLPVLAFIHGGGFMFGGASAYSPKVIMTQSDMIMVSIDYRVGPFGFLTTEDEIIHGNLGLKDQRQALRWIKKNIHLFGGDPDKILLLGQSAGGASVHLHILRKETEGLISAAAAISGSALNPWVMQKNAKENTKILATSLNCPLDDGENMKLCLQNQSIQDIHAAVMKMFRFLEFPFNLFGPIVEAKHIPEAFITEEPRRLMEKGEIANIPLMATLTTEEGAYNAGLLLSKNENGVEYIEELNERWNELAPYMLFYYNESCIYKEKLSESLREMYMGKEPFVQKTYLQLQRMFSDVLFVNGILETIKLHRMFGSSPIYGYVYGNPHNNGAGNYFSNNQEFQFGAAHADDEALFLPFTFSTNYTSQPNDFKIAKNLVKMFESFVLEGVPRFKDTRLPENRNNLQPMQFLQIFQQNYCSGPWLNNINQQCQEKSRECLAY